MGAHCANSAVAGAKIFTQLDGCKAVASGKLIKLKLRSSKNLGAHSPLVHRNCFAALVLPPEQCGKGPREQSFTRDTFT